MIASKEELSAWRAHPVTMAYEADLRSRIDNLRSEIADRIIKDDIPAARAGAGALKAYEEMLADLFVDDRATVEEPDNYVDPAALTKEP